MAVDFFAQKNNLGEFEFSKKSHALVFENNDMWLAKPQTFMNESGKTAVALLKNQKESTLIVVHDDIDLTIGTLKISKDSGAGGHKGVASIIDALGTQDFIRIKIGICPAQGKPATVESFVIKKFTKEEREILQPVIEKSATALKMITEENLQKAMNEFN